MSSDETFRNQGQGSEGQQPIPMSDDGGSGGLVSPPSNTVDPSWPAPDPRYRAPEAAAPGAYGAQETDARHTSAGSTPPPPGTWGAGTAFAEPAAPAPRSRRRAGRPVTMLAAVALVAALAGGGSAALVGQWTDDDSVGTTSSNSASGSPVSSNTGSSAVASVANAVSPSVVEIKATSGNGQATGSGVIISEDGEIITNNHVISGAQQLTVQFSDGSTAEAQVVGTNADNDIALIKVVGKTGLKAATLGDSDQVKVGDEVVAIGSPEGLTGTVTSGIISAKDRDVTVQKDQEQQQPQGQWPFGFGGEEYNGRLGSGETTTYKALQTDASINPGNSGGPLVDLEGKVIAINSAMYSSGSASDAGSVGLGFAIPINDVKTIVDDLRNN